MTLKKGKRMNLVQNAVFAACVAALTSTATTASAESSGGANLCGGSFMSSYRQHGIDVERYSAASPAYTTAAERNLPSPRALGKAGRYPSGTRALPARFC
jgi:hypothetical protein